MTFLPNSPNSYALFCSCDFHDKIDNQYCALGSAVKQAWLISESILSCYKVEPIEGKHLPKSEVMAVTETPTEWRANDSWNRRGQFSSANSVASFATEAASGTVEYNQAILRPALPRIIATGPAAMDSESVVSGFGPGRGSRFPASFSDVGDLDVDTDPMEEQPIVDPRISVSEGHYIAEAARIDVLKGHQVMDVMVHIDSEDDAQAKPSIHLPQRHLLLAHLNSRLGSPLPDSVQIVLHYLGGKVEAELLLDAEVDMESLRQKCAAITHDDPYFRAIRLYRSGAPI